MRVLTSPLRTALNQRRTRYAGLVEVQFPSGPVYMNDSPQTIFYAGKEYLGGGRLLSMKQARQDASMGAHKAEIVLDGLDAAAISLAFNEPTENSMVTFKLLVQDPDSGAIVGEIVLDTYTVSEVQVTPPTSAEQQ